jgi:hypothetical protein
MTLDRAKRILGPIRCHYSRKRKVWLLDQRPAHVLEIVAAAKERLEQVEQSP